MKTYLIAFAFSSLISVVSCGSKESQSSSKQLPSRGYIILHKMWDQSAECLIRFDGSNAVYSGSNHILGTKGGVGGGLFSTGQQIIDSRCMVVQYQQCTDYLRGALNYSCKEVNVYPNGEKSSI